MKNDLHDLLVATAEHSGGIKAGANITDALFAIADAIETLARRVNDLGNGDAATPMGAIEAFGAHIGEKMDAMTAAIDGLRRDEA